MTKGTYTVGEGSDATSRRDASFKSCLCALLVFIAICLIILLAGIKWAKAPVTEEVTQGESKALGSKGNDGKTTKPAEKFSSKSVSTEITTRITTIVNKTPPTDVTTVPTAVELLPTTNTTTSTTRSILISSTFVNSAPSSSAKTASTTPSLLPPRTTTTSTTKFTLISIITPAKRPTTASTNSLPNIITPQTVTVDKTTSSPQGAFSYTTTDNITTSTSNVNEIQKSTHSSTSPATENNKPQTFEELENNDHMNTETSNESTEKATEPFTAAVDYMKPHTAVGSLFTTLIHSSTRDREATSEEPATDVTETNITPLIVLQNANQKSSVELTSPLTKLLNPVTESTLSTTAERKLGIYDEQKPVDDTKYDDDNWTSKTIINTQTTERSKITDKITSWLEKTYTITNSSLLFRKPEPICLSVACKSAASHMLSFMDHSVDACNDFYEFACGGMPADSADSDTWKRLSEQLYLINETAPTYLLTFKTFYDSCVSHEYEFNYQQRIDGILKLVNEVGEILDEKPAKGTIDMTELFAKLILRQSLPFIDIDIDIDKQSSKFILKLTLPSPTSVLKESGHWSALTEAQKRCLDEQRHELEQENLELTEIYKSYLTCQKNHTIYIKSIETVVKALGFYSHLNNTFEENQKIQDLRTTIEWDILDHLNTLPAPSNIRQAVLFKNYTILKVSDLQIQYSLLEWKKLFSIVTGRTVEDNAMVQVYFPSYFRDIFENLHTVADWKLNNALIAIYAQSLYENLVIPQAKHTRESYCLQLSSKLFHDVSSNIYMKTWAKTEMEQSQQFLREIFARLKQNLRSALQKEEWLADASLTRALLKLNKMELTFNKQEDSYNNEADLNIKYSAVTITTDFQENAVKMLEMDRRMRYALVEKTYSTDYLWSYFLNAYDSVPTSFYSKGLIMAPLGMIKQPVKGFPGYVTMAQIGLFLAKEIGRNFDPVGIQNGMTFTPEAQLAYQDLEAIMENESLFNVTRFIGHQQATFTADPKLSVNERITDNTGFRLISDTFDSFGDQTLLPWVSTTFSIQQIFYITVAQEYCQKTDMPEFMQQLFESEILPASLRVENMMTNSKQFSKAFDCPLGTPMNNNPSKIQFPHLQEEEEGEEEEGQEQEEH